MNTKKLPLLASTLIAASFALSVPALAETYTLPTTTQSSESPTADSNGLMASGDYAIASNASQGWISPNGSSGDNISYSNISFAEGTTFSGSGVFGIFFDQGSGDTVESVDLQNVDASNFSGQLIVLNNWNNETDVKLSGTSWSNVEYLFANAVDDTTLAAKYGLEAYTRGDLNSDRGGKTLDDYLALQGDTTLAGVTGATKGTTGTGTASDLVLSDHEFITVANNGDTLTIAGTGEYAFYGTAGTSSARMSLAMTGSGSQTFGGTNYLADVTVSNGTLALSGTTSITGSVSVAEGSTLELGGEITLSSAITNAGTVVIDSDVVFVLDNLGSGDTYTIIDNTGGGTITGWNDLDYSNFSISGTTLTSDRQITFGADGTITVDTSKSAESLTWAGTSGSTWNNNVSSNTVWTNDGTSSSADYFVNGDNVTFNGSGTDTVTVSGDVHAGTMTVSSGTYTFSADVTNGGTLKADTLDVSGGNITFGVSTTIGDFKTASSGSAAGNTITLKEGTTVTATSLTNAWGTNFVLGEGSVLTVTGETSFEPGGTARTVSGSGTFSTGSLTLSNYANYTFTGVTFIADTVTMGSNAGSLTFSDASATIGTFNMSNSSSTITFTGGGTYTIGSYTESASYTTFAIGENTTVTVGTFSSAWGETFSFSSGSVLNVTEELTLHTNSMETMDFNGGTLNAEKLSLSNNEKLTFSNGYLNIGSGGITGASWGESDYLVFGDGLTVGVYNGESWSTDATIQFTKSGTGTTFSTNTDESITLSGSLSGSGFTNTGSGTLTLSGTVSLSSAITNSGNIVLSDSVSIAVDGLTAGTYTTDGKDTSYYEIITGVAESSASVTFEGGSASNFTLNGGTLSGSWSIYTENGYLVIYSTANDLTWAGTSGSNTWGSGSTDWTDGGSSTTFSDGDNVTFGAISGDISSTVNISESLLAGTITVSDNYTFTFTNGVKVEAQYVDVASGKTLTLQLATGASSAEFHMDSESFYDFFYGSSSENHGNVEIGSGVTFYLSDLNDSCSFYSGNTGVSITGTGTLSVGGTGGIGLYLPNFQGTVEFRSGTVRFGVSNSNETGIYNSNATLKFDDGAGITLVGSTSSAVSAKLVFAEGSHTIDSGTATGEFSGAIDAAAATLTKSGSGTITFSGGGSIGTLTANVGTVIFSGESKAYTIDTITKSGNNNEGKLEVASGTTVNAGTLNASWHIGTIQVDGVLNISDSIVLGSGYQEIFTGTGTVTVGTLQVGHTNGSNAGSIKVDGGLTLIANSVTKGQSANSYIELGNATIGTSNSSGLTFSDATSFTLSATDGSTTFNTNLYDTTAGAFTTTGTTITISVAVSGSGAMTVTGNGSLTLSGANTYSGGTIIDAGKVVAANNSALGTGTVTIENGGQLSVSSGVTITNAISVTLSEAYQCVSYTPASASAGSGQIAAYASGDEGIYAITGTGGTLSTEITIFLDDTIKQLLADAGEDGVSFYLVDISNLDGSSDFTVSLSEALSDYNYNYDTDTGILWIAAAPEPELFSIFFGLGALGLVATRRRKRRA